MGRERRGTCADAGGAGLLEPLLLDDEAGPDEEAGGDREQQALDVVRRHPRVRHHPAPQPRAAPSSHAREPIRRPADRPLAPAPPPPPAHTRSGEAAAWSGARSPSPVGCSPGGFGYPPPRPPLLLDSFVRLRRGRRKVRYPRAAEAARQQNHQKRLRRRRRRRQGSQAGGRAGTAVSPAVQEACVARV